MGAPLPFKRNELATPKVQVFFVLFALLSLGLLWMFLSEEYRMSLAEKLAAEDFETFTFSNHSMGSLNAFTTPLGALVLSIWVLCSLVFAWAFNRRLWAMFQLFFSLSFFIVLLFNFWTFFVSFALEDQDSKILAFANRLEYSLTLKTSLLLFWGFFSIYLCFTVVTTKYLGVFNRLDYLFNSIARGNWDSFMFFRTHDPFAFLATSFNALKDHYLDEIHKQDELLIVLKDKILSDPKNPGLKQELLTLIRNRTDSKPA